MRNLDQSRSSEDWLGLALTFHWAQINQAGTQDKNAFLVGKKASIWLHLESYYHSSASPSPLRNPCQA